MSEFSFEGLFDESEKSDYVVQCNHPVFASYAISTYTSGQFYRFLQKHPGVMTHVSNSATSGVCTVWGNVVDAYKTKADCDDASGDWVGGLLASFDLEKTFTKIFSAKATSTDQVPMFARYDILKKRYIEVIGKGWKERYGKALAIGARLTKNGKGDIISNLVFLNTAANKGLYRFVATDSDVIKSQKLNVQLLLNEIQSSLSGVVTYKQNLGFNLHPDCATFESGVHFQLHLYDESVEVRSNKRAVVQRGNPRFAMQPTLAFGVQYAGAIPPNGSPGAYHPTQPGGENNPQNMVGGELPLSYNPNTKEFEAGNKNLLARLLTDVAGVGLNNVNMSTVDTTTAIEMGPEGASYFGNFATGWAMPLQMHNNNPYEYGPTLKNEDCDKDKKHKIRVVNRSSKMFPTGQIVMCTKIDGEWIIMDFGASNINVKSFDFGKWQFWKLIANKDAYRRDDRYHYDPNHATYHESIIRDNIYEGYFRAKFYQDISKHLNDYVIEDFGSRRCIDKANALGGNHSLTLGVMNGGYDRKTSTGAGGIPNTTYTPRKINFVGSRRYMQTTSFDQLGRQHGGLSNKNMIGAVNPFHDETGGGVENVIDDGYHHRKLYPHWGPVLKHGYDSVSLTELGTTDQGFGVVKGYRAGGTDQGDLGSLLNPLDNQKLADIKIGETYGMTGWSDTTKNVFDAPDGMGIHVPADVGTNAAPYAENGSPIEDMNELLRCVNIVSPTTATGPVPGKQGYVGGNAPDLMAGRNSTAHQDIVAGVRQYLGDAVDLSFDVNNIQGDPPAAFWNQNPSNTNAVYRNRNAQKSWRLGERPAQARSVYVAKDDGSIPTGVLPDSAYNLKPVSSNHIVFIPLTAEHCGTFDFRSNNDFRGAGADQYAFNSWLGQQETIFNSANQLFGSVVYSGPGGGSVFFAPGPDKHVFPTEFINRNGAYGWSKRYGQGDFGANRIDYVGSHGDGVATILLNHRSAGMKANGDMIMASDGDLYESVDKKLGAGQGWGIPYGIYSRHKHKYGRPGGQGFAPNELWQGMGADGPATIGITSAKCTVKVRGYEIAIKSTLTAGIPRQIPKGWQRWGSSSDLQTDFGTTAGYAKVYDAWPEEQTIFDPRYFAVMHFNDGLLLSAASGKFVGDANQNDASKMDTYDDMWRWVDNEETSVDYRIPTMSGVPGDMTAKELPAGAPVFAGLYGGANGLQDAIRVKSEWMVSTTRRGMLLPFKWRKKTIRLAFHETGHNITSYDKTTGMSSVSQVGTPTRQFIKPSVWIAASGTGYTVGHTFEVGGGNSDIAGSMVITEVNTFVNEGPLGCITELKPGNHVTTPTNEAFGEGYDPQFFVSIKDYHKILAMDPNRPVSQAPQLQGTPSVNRAGQANTGVGAVVYALHGKCSVLDKLDLGPLKQQSAVRFTAASNGSAGAKQLAPFARKLSIPRPNDDYAYDIFMQHHNDISHVYMHGKLGLDKKAQFTDVEIIGV
jgi:hypothetical protein